MSKRHAGIACPFRESFDQHIKCRANSGRIESQEDSVVKQCFLNVTYALAYNGSRSVAAIASAADAEGKISNCTKASIASA
jgi:hypothetical protein